MVRARRARARSTGIRAVDDQFHFDAHWRGLVDGAYLLVDARTHRELSFLDVKQGPRP